MIVHVHTAVSIVPKSTVSVHSMVGIPSKSLNVYDLGMKMYTSQPITALLGRKAELPLAERCTFSCQNCKRSGTLTVAERSDEVLRVKLNDSKDFASI